MVDELLKNMQLVTVGEESSWLCIPPPPLMTALL
jgi:hypothetical protein